jgi:PadR family transcriptional regulator PadR
VASSTRPYLPLLVLYLLEEEREAWGYRLCQLIKERTKGEYELKEGTLYPLLHALESSKLIRGEWRRSSEGPERKYYSLTDKGKKFLAREQRRFATIAAVLLRSAK